MFIRSLSVGKRNSMKVLYFAPLAFVLLANSCSKDVELKEGTMEIKFRRCAEGKIAGDNLRFCFDSVIEDSRCPANAICIWQGAAVARFSITKNNETSSFRLSTITMPPKYIKDTIVMGYKIEFINMSPYPGTVPSPIPDNDRKVEIKITKQ
jgi:hypothetical protein